MKLTEAKEEVQKESNQKSFMAIEIRLFGEIFGTITDFNSALGMVLRSRVRIWPITFFFFNVFGEVRTQVVKHRKGVYEGYFQTVNGPIPFKVHSPEVANQNSQISRIISFLGISTKTERSSKNQQKVKITKNLETFQNDILPMFLNLETVSRTTFFRQNEFVVMSNGFVTEHKKLHGG